MEHRVDRGDDGSTFWLGLMAGGLIGAAVGLLLAPKRGAELRSELSESAGRLQRAARHRYQQAADRIGHMSGPRGEGEGRPTAAEIAERGREAFRQAMGWSHAEVDVPPDDRSVN